MQGPGHASSLAEWLAWLETLHPKKIDLSLNRIRTVLEVLGLEHPPFRVVAIGGTNGKGSCVAYLANIYLQAGYRTGAFTSPHLIRFNERIAVDGVDADDTELVEAFVAMDEARDRVTLSYFEASAVAALIHFARKRVDVAVLEVGMGGRLDAVNAVDADAALIASVGLDHEEWLGNDRESIGFEKAGIMRADRPAIIADPAPPLSLRKAARDTGADALFIGEDFSVARHGDSLLVRCRNASAREVPLPRFGGPEQWLNVAACVQLTQCLAAALPVSDSAVDAGIRATAPAGRADRRHIDGVEWIFDVAHNPAAAQQLAGTLQTMPSEGRTLGVFGALRDKDIRGVLAQFASIIDAWHVITPRAERAAAAADIAETLASLGAKAAVSAFDDVAAACAAARSTACSGDRVVVFGSFYVVGPALSALELYSHPPA
ncbi:MAG: folylpolyglutamate synthase/dihydrofolate synthase family protein [Gammaproteobacteria bacterium]|jgi:dihydrofolate synthase/folylpolyglutamate synthase